MARHTRVEHPRRGAQVGLQTHFANIDFWVGVGSLPVGVHCGCTALDQVQGRLCATSTGPWSSARSLALACRSIAVSVHLFIRTQVHGNQL